MFNTHNGLTKYRCGRLWNNFIFMLWDKNKTGFYVLCFKILCPFYVSLVFFVIGIDNKNILKKQTRYFLLVVFINFDIIYYSIFYNTHSYFMAYCIVLYCGSMYYDKIDFITLDVLYVVSGKSDLFSLMVSWCW